MFAVLETSATRSAVEEERKRLKKRLNRPVICLPREPPCLPNGTEAAAVRRAVARAEGVGGGRGTPRALARDAVLLLARRASEWPPTATATVPPAAPLPPCHCCLLPAPARAGRTVCDRVVTPRASCVCRAGQGDDELYEGFNSSPPPQATPAPLDDGPRPSPNTSASEPLARARARTSTTVRALTLRRRRGHPLGRAA